MNIDYSAKK